MEIVKYCQEQFNFKLSSVTLAPRTRILLDKLNECDNCVIKIQYVYNSFVFTALY